MELRLQKNQFKLPPDLARHQKSTISPSDCIKSEFDTESCTPKHSLRLKSDIRRHINFATERNRACGQTALRAGCRDALGTENIQHGALWCLPARTLRDRLTQ